MKNLLFPHRFQLIGWILFVPCLILGVLLTFPFHIVNFSSFTIETITIDVAIIGIVLGALFIVCSKERVEDEMTRSIRLTSLLNALYVYAGLLIAGTIFINGLLFLSFAIINIALFPIIFMVSFQIEIHRYNKIADNEE